MDHRTLRRQLGLTQQRLADLLGVHPMTVSKWERGRLAPNPRQQALLRVLAEAAERGDPLLIDARGGLELLADVLNAAFRITQQEVSMDISASNVLQGKIVDIKEGIVTARVVLEIAPKTHIVSVITVDSVKRLKLKVGSRASAVIKATEVMLAKP